jgi:hypothetical protein
LRGCKNEIVGGHFAPKKWTGTASNANPYPDTKNTPESKLAQFWWDFAQVLFMNFLCSSPYLLEINSWRRKVSVPY